MFFIEIASILISIVLTLPTAQVLLRVISGNTRYSIYASLLLGIDMSDEEYSGDALIPLCVAIVFGNILGYLLDPVVQIVICLLMCEKVLSRVLRVRKQLKSIDKLLSLTKTRCENHPEIIKAICVEDNGDLLLVCPKCDPKLADDFGITIGDCIELDKQDLGDLE